MNRLLIPALLLLPALARADRVPRAVEHPVDPLPIRVLEQPLSLDVLVEPAAIEGTSGAADGGEVAALGGGASAEPGPAAGGVEAGPWRLLGEPVDESRCRAGRLSSDATTALAVCRGTDPDDPRSEHVILRQNGALLRYPPALSPGAEVGLSRDGLRFAGSFQAGAGRAVHLVDLVTRRALILNGGWRDPGAPVLAGDAEAVAFVARVGGKPTVVLARLGEVRAEDRASRIWVGGEPLTVRGISDDGRRVLLTAREIDLVQAIVIDADRATRFDLSGRKGDVLDAALHGGGEQAVFTSRVGGACAVFWVELGGRRRDDFLGSVEHCYGGVGVDESRRLVAHEGVRGGGRRGFVWDRKRDVARLILPPGCADPHISGDGRFVAALCGAGTPGPGTWRFAVPEEEGRR